MILSSINDNLLDSASLSLSTWQACRKLVRKKSNLQPVSFLDLTMKKLLVNEISTVIEHFYPSISFMASCVKIEGYRTGIKKDLRKQLAKE